MNNSDIKKYDDLNIEEKEILDIIRDLKLSKDYATFSLYSFQLSDIIDDYEELKNLRQSIQMKFFKIFENIVDDDLADGEIDINLWAQNRQNEEEIWDLELDSIYEIKNSLDYGMKLIESGEAEKMILEKENYI